MGLAEEEAEDVFHFGGFDYVDAELGGVDAFHVVGWDDDVLETEFLGFCNALLKACDLAYFARKPYFASDAHTALDGNIDIRRYYCCYHCHIEGRVVHLYASGDVEKHVFLCKLEAYALFEHGEEHVHALVVEAGD